MHATNELFRIYCLHCKQETLATKYARRWHDDFGGFRKTRKPVAKWCGVNRCMACGTLYDAMLPTDFDGKRGSRVSGVAA